MAKVDDWRIASAALDICDYFERLGCDADITDEMTNAVFDIINDAMTICGYCNGDGHGDSRSYENGVMVRADKCPKCNGTGKTEAGNG